MTTLKTVLYVHHPSKCETFKMKSSANFFKKKILSKSNPKTESMSTQDATLWTNPLTTQDVVNQAEGVIDVSSRKGQGKSQGSRDTNDAELREKIRVLLASKEALMRKCDAVILEKESLLKEQGLATKQMQRLEQEMEAMTQERNLLKREKESLVSDKVSLVFEINMLKEKNKSLIDSSNEMNSPKRKSNAEGVCNLRAASPEAKNSIGEIQSAEASASHSKETVETCEQLRQQVDSLSSALDSKTKEHEQLLLEGIAQREKNNNEVAALRYSIMKLGECGKEWKEEMAVEKERHEQEKAGLRRTIAALQRQLKEREEIELERSLSDSPSLTPSHSPFNAANLAPVSTNGSIDLCSSLLGQLPRIQEVSTPRERDGDFNSSSDDATPPAHGSLLANEGYDSLRDDSEQQPRESMFLDAEVSKRLDAMMSKHKRWGSEGESFFAELRQVEENTPSPLSRGFDSGDEDTGGKRLERRASSLGLGSSEGISLLDTPSTSHSDMSKLDDLTKLEDEIGMLKARLAASESLTESRTRAQQETHEQELQTAQQTWEDKVIQMQEQFDGFELEMVTQMEMQQKLHELEMYAEKELMTQREAGAMEKLATVQTEYLAAVAGLQGALQEEAEDKEIRLASQFMVQHAVAKLKEEQLKLECTVQWNTGDGQLRRRTWHPEQWYNCGRRVWGQLGGLREPCRLCMAGIWRPGGGPCGQCLPGVWRILLQMHEDCLALRQQREAVDALVIKPLQDVTGELDSRVRAQEERIEKLREELRDAQRSKHSPDGRRESHQFRPTFDSAFERSDDENLMYNMETLAAYMSNLFYTYPLDQRGETTQARASKARNGEPRHFERQRTSSSATSRGDVLYRSVDSDVDIDSFRYLNSSGPGPATRAERLKDKAARPLQSPREKAIRVPSSPRSPRRSEQMSQRSRRQEKENSSKKEFSWFTWILS